MGCLASKDTSNVIEVQPVVPGKVTVFGAKYLVPHGKRVHLCFKASQIKSIATTSSGESCSFFVTDVTLGEQEATPLFDVHVGGGGEKKRVMVNDPMTKEGIFVLSKNENNGGGSTHAVYTANSECLLFEIAPFAGSNKNLPQQCCTQNLKNQKGSPIQLVSDTNLARVQPSPTAGTIRLVSNTESPSLKSAALPIIAKLCSPQDVRHFLPDGFVGKDSNVVMELAPGVDMALIVALFLSTVVS